MLRAASKTIHHPSYLPARSPARLRHHPRHLSVPAASPPAPAPDPDHSRPLHILVLRVIMLLLVASPLVIFIISPIFLLLLVSLLRARCICVFHLSLSPICCTFPCCLFYCFCLFSRVHRFWPRSLIAAGVHRSARQPPAPPPTHPPARPPSHPPTSPESFTGRARSNLTDIEKQFLLPARIAARSRNLTALRTCSAGRAH